MASRKRIGDLLIEAGLISEDQLQNALREQKELKMRLGDVLTSRGYITEQQLVETLEYQLGIPHVQLYRQKIDPNIISLIPPRLAKMHVVLPLRAEGNKLIVAMADPLDYFAIDDLRMSTGFRIEPVIASKDELLRAINRYYGLQESVEQIIRNLQIPDESEPKIEREEDSPVVQMVNQLIEQAVQLGASDIHLDPQEDSLRIRYRVDGMMRTERTLPPHMQSVLLARIKVMGNMNVAERRVPQDGRVELDVEYRKIDIRIATLPTIHGEKAVLRILDMGNGPEDLEKLGFSPRHLQIFQKAIHAPHGVVLITGPTGSGKTTTLYSALVRLNRDDVNIVTVEDPVEYQMQGINQMQVNPAAGLTFARGLRSILRSDPNIIMIGEIRDAETAEIAVRSAMTGHLVLSTLHTNSSVNAITRLIDMGIEPFLVASSVNCVVAQRLVRKVCVKCAKPYIPNAEEIELLRTHGLPAGGLKLGEGCESCGQTGYKGRIAIHEVLEIDDTLRTMIVQKRSDNEYRTYAERKGMVSLLADGLSKAAEGVTTIAEVFRVAET